MFTSSPATNVTKKFRENSSLPPLLSLLTLNNTEIDLPQLTISPLSSQKSCEEVGVRSKMATFPLWLPERLDRWNAHRRRFVWRVLAVEPLLWQMIFLPKQTHLFSSPLIHIHTWTHTFHLLTPHNGTTVSAASNRHLPIAPRSSLLLNTGAHKRWAWVQPPTNFAMQRESAVEVCQHASLTPNSQKTTGSRHAPVYGCQRERGEERRNDFSKIFRLKSSSGSGAPLNYEGLLFSSYYSK